MIASEHASANAHITLRSLIAARWALIALVGASVLVATLAGDRLPAGLIPRSEHPAAIVATLVVWTALNLGSTLVLTRGRASERLAGAHLLIDALALSVLLALSGGPANPFTLLYFLPITLATQVSPRWTWLLAGACMACFAALFVLAPVGDLAEDPRPAAPDMEPSHDHIHAHADAETPSASDEGHGEHFEGHQRGMWIAFGLTGVLMTVFVHRTALALALQRDELTRLRQVALEDRHLTALGALAAGAGHELGTPLGTIKLLIEELPHLDGDEAKAALATVREQLDRCKHIVSRMASPELRVSAFGPERGWPLDDLAIALERLALDVPLRLHADAAVRATTCRQPLEALTQILRELISNGADACRRTHDPHRGVHVTVEITADVLRVDIVDEGVGMTPELLEDAFTPFLTDRSERQGMGLGLYLARAHLRQLGGSIELESEPERGTSVHVSLPLINPEARA